MQQLAGDSLRASLTLDMAVHIRQPFWQVIFVSSHFHHRDSLYAVYRFMPRARPLTDTVPGASSAAYCGKREIFSHEPHYFITIRFMARRAVVACADLGYVSA